MAFGYPYNLQNGPVPTYFNTNYMPPQMAQPQMQPPAQQQADFSQFATRAKLKGISDKLARFEAEIGGLNT